MSPELRARSHPLLRALLIPTGGIREKLKSLVVWEGAELSWNRQKMVGIRVSQSRARALHGPGESYSSGLEEM